VPPDALLLLLRAARSLQDGVDRLEQPRAHQRHSEVDVEEVGRLVERWRDLRLLSAKPTECQADGVTPGLRVAVPFSQRSLGLTWFFSFLVWFDSVKVPSGTRADLVLLLDEPGLSLHGLAQADLLRYNDDLSEEHQVIPHDPVLHRL